MLRKSQALIIVYKDTILLLKRKHPYGISDNLNLCFSRVYAKAEKRDIFSYTCGINAHFEDRYDFPKGRGHLFEDALNEVKEETGYIINSDNILEEIKNYSRVCYTGLDNNNYVIELHVVVLKELPPKCRRGELHLFYPVWVNINEACNIYENKNDERCKSNNYYDILKNLKYDVQSAR